MSSSSSSHQLLIRLKPNEVSQEIKDPVEENALKQAKAILDEIVIDPKRKRVVDPLKLLKVAKRLGDIIDDTTTNGNQLHYTCSKEECKAAFDGLSDVDRNALINIHQRVKVFAEAQRKSVHDMEIDIPGGKAGHTVSPCRVAGCYAPGGRYPLPSSVIMTAVTARAAGCQIVIVASPRPAPITLAAAYVAGADQFLCIGGAQAVGAMAYGVESAHDTYPSVPRCDVIVGPGNKWVTAAKSIVNGYCGIDMLAGPSEVLVICDKTANAKIIASDLIAQAEHDVVARAILLSNNDNAIIDAIDSEVIKQLSVLPEPNQSTAREAMKQSFAVLCSSLDECIQICDDIAPEHLEIQTVDSETVGKRCSNYGGLFIGEDAAEVLGDYGAGPNHTLPTGGTGRYTGGLSVFNFLRVRTWMNIHDRTASQSLVQDSIVMARLEGLEGHARAAEARLL